MSDDTKEQTFWEHLDDLRKVIFRIVVVLFVLVVALFFFKNELFTIVLAPTHDDFLFYRLLQHLSESLQMPSLCPDKFDVTLINTELTGQFMAHLRVSFYAAIIVGMPYFIYLIFSFIRPALYDSERRKILKTLIIGQVLFLIGIALSYFIIFPLSFRFLALYEVDEMVSNMTNLNSYIDTMVMLTVMMGIMFELPLVSMLLAKLGFISSSMMTKYRRHAILAILVVSAILTPTTDAFTLLLVGLPIYVLYEVSIWVVRHCAVRRNATK